jgi:hypothetical protein
VKRRTRGKEEEEEEEDARENDGYKKTGLGRRARGRVMRLFVFSKVRCAPFLARTTTLCDTI